MANRAYLYTANEDFSKMRDVSEWPSDVPFFYKLVCSVNPEIVNSKIWNYEHPIALQSDFEAGLKRFYDFCEYLKTQPKINAALVDAAVEETKTFWAEQVDRKGKWFFLEGGEAFDLMSDMIPIESQNKELLSDVQDINADVERLLKERPENMFEGEHKSYSIKNLETQQEEMLQVYWTHVTYFSFNNSDS